MEDREPTEASNSAPDAASILADLRDEIRERRAYLVMNDPNEPHALGLAEMRRSVEAVNELWFISAHLPITWQMRIVGRLAAYSKRLVRILLRWYINPIVEQQNRFNSATARAITVMNAYQERMTREWLMLDERVAKLEGSGNMDLGLESDGLDEPKPKTQNYTIPNPQSPSPNP